MKGLEGTFQPNGLDKGSKGIAERRVLLLQEEAPSWGSLCGVDIAVGGGLWVGKWGSLGHLPGTGHSW